MPKQSPRVIAVYLDALQKNLARGDATEGTHRPALKTLLEAIGNDIAATNEPKRILCGAPDFNIIRKKVPIGHIETKDIDTNLDEIEKGKGPHGEQFKRYLAGLPNWVLTDYLEFHWFVGGEKRLSARLAEIDTKGKLILLSDGEEKVAQLLDAFFKQPALTIGNPKDLAQRMAGATRIIRDLVRAAFDKEVETGWLHNWLAAFREVLIPDLSEHQFADMFAQTLAYGLFAARVHTPPSKEFSRELAAFNLPKTNPFLRKLFFEIAGVDMPETIAWAVDDIVELLKHADMRKILKDFGKGKGKEDPVVHFYETFLAAYDPALRKIRGVYYTPEPVVSYIVRSVDHLLKVRFNRPRGVADENTLILDPATGTATFLYFVVQKIYETFSAQKGAWNGYVDEHLLNRIFGFELLIAPYAIAHLKLGTQLQETGYKFGSDQRLGVYLTNTLEEAAKRAEEIFAQWISEEANAAAKIKRDDPILVVLGNPPYQGISANRGEWITKLIKDYRVVDGKPLGEKKVWLADDYVKFIRFGQWRINRTGQGIMALITNNGYLDNPTFRGMRQSLMNEFTEISVLNLHGSSKKKERTPAGGPDVNVFDIQQGVAIAFFVKVPGKSGPAAVHHADLWGTRESKYEQLFSSDVSSTEWQRIEPRSPYYFFVPREETNEGEYQQGWKVDDIFPLSNSGIVTARDKFVLDFDREKLRTRIKRFCDKDADDATIKQEFNLAENYAWRVSDARKQLMKVEDWQSYFAELLYRPFNFRHVLFHDAVVWRPRKDVMTQMLRGNVALITTRQTRDLFGVLVTDKIAGHKSVAAYDINTVFPLFLYDTENHKSERGKAITMALFEKSPGYQTRRPNLSPVFLKALAKKLKLSQTEPHGLPKGISPEDIFHYAYAVFHSPTYRTRYAEFLKIDFPRLPLTSDLKLFRELAAKGKELVALHLLESPILHDFITEFPVKGSNEVEKVRYTDTDKRVWINKTQYFGGIPKAVWEFHIGGYQVCEKWLKDRKGRELGYADIKHYQRIIVALAETIRAMAEVDALIPSWPIT
jgi:predicted helicase